MAEVVLRLCPRRGQSGASLAEQPDRFRREHLGRGVAVRLRWLVVFLPQPVVKAAVWGDEESQRDLCLAVFHSAGGALVREDRCRWADWGPGGVVLSRAVERGPGRHSGLGDASKNGNPFML